MTLHHGTTWTTIVSSILLAAALLWPTQGLAQDPLAGLDELETQTEVAYDLPRGIRCHYQSETFQCFSLAEMRTLLHIDLQLQYYRDQFLNSEQQNRVLSAVIEERDVIIAAREAQIETLRLARQELYDSWKAENKRRLEVENEPNIGSFLAWGLAAAEAVAILTLVVVLLVGG